jgi:GNAT superfamily N-acetyltransferase
MRSNGGYPQGELIVRRAATEDADFVVDAVSTLLVELLSEPPDREEMLTAAHELISSHDSGVVLLAEAERVVVGMLAASWQIAIHAPGSYALIQDLWVSPGWRSKAVGRAMLDMLHMLACDLHLARIEVGLPQEKFAALNRTVAFYSANGFEPTGDRLRRRLP